MQQPTNREQFAQYCLRKLGGGVTPVNVSPEQVDDAISDAVLFAQKYSLFGSEVQYLAHAITQDDLNNKFVEMPEGTVEVIRAFATSSTGATSGISGFGYNVPGFGVVQDSWSPFGTLNGGMNTGQNLSYQVQMSQYMSQMEFDSPNRSRPVRWNMATNRLYMDINGFQLKVGMHIMLEQHMAVDPRNYRRMWQDTFLKKYATALIKQAWGQNLSVFTNVQLPGGMSLNGDKILTDQVEEIKQLEADVLNSGLWGGMVSMFTG